MGNNTQIVYQKNNNVYLNSLKGKLIEQDLLSDKVVQSLKNQQTSQGIKCKKLNLLNCCHAL